MSDARLTPDDAKDDPEFSTLVTAFGDSQAVIEAARATADPKTLDPSVPQIVIVPAGSVGYEPDLSRWREVPVRKTGIYRPATVDALSAYVDWQQVDGSTTVWVHPTSGKVEAIFDDNGDETPGYRDHRALLQLQPTPEWKYWADKDKQMMPQSDFAEHIEGGLEEIQTPDSATMLEIAQSFHATHEASFRQATRLADGTVQIKYDEEIKATAGATGQLSVPTVILLAVAPFYGEDLYKLTARLRYRLAGGKLSLGYILDRPESVQRDALEGIADRLTESFSRVFVGEAPA